MVGEGDMLYSFVTFLPDQKKGRMMFQRSMRTEFASNIYVRGSMRDGIQDRLTEALERALYLLNSSLQESILVDRLPECR